MAVKTNHPQTGVSARFKYHGTVRHLEDVIWEKDVVRGREVRKGGQFSNKFKSFSVEKIEILP